MIGLMIICAILVLIFSVSARGNAENLFFNLLKSRQPNIITQTNAINSSELSHQQAAAVTWLSKKYRIAPEPLNALVHNAYEIGLKKGIDPTIILAVMAIESRFNPFIQSPMGAQGLMQVITKIHKARYDEFGGSLAAFDPSSNLQVGAQVLREFIALAGSLEGGLRLYVGGSGPGGDGGYVEKVMAEHKRLQQVISDAKGKPSA